MFLATQAVSKLSKHIDENVRNLLSGRRQVGQSQDTIKLWDARPQVQAILSMSTRRLPKRDVKILHVQDLGKVSSLDTRVERDLGFPGKLGNHILLTYGDTMYRDEKWSDRFIGMTCNSVGIATADPTKVHDPILNADGFPQFFLEPTAEYGENYGEYALGITNVIEVGPGRGILYFLLNYRPGGQQHFLGSGVAEVFIDTSLTGRPIPRTRRLGKWWWDGETEPNYGDICSLRHHDYIYAYGHMKDNPWIYVTRVQVHLVFDLNAYEYWNGSFWQRERLYGPNLGEKESVFWKIQQGQMMWSCYHNCLLFVYCDAWWTDQVLIKTASEPQGPWSEAITVHKATLAKEGGCIYTAIPHPYYDESCRTLVITYTNMPNIVQAIKVSFE